MNPITVTPTDADKYRADVDGLRAVAVLSVVWFHFGVELFSGGFVGVDVFFVISGFLITRLITESTSAGTFTFGGFYLRRVRRLLPALLFTVFATFVVGAIVFSPQHLERLGGSALHGLLSISNFFFWFESGYFDADSNVKPLLHLWSLSVEEQFYFIWPATLVLLYKLGVTRTARAIFLVGLGGASWWFAEWYLPIDPSAAFYMLPSRIVEFCMGAIIVQLVRISVPNWVKEFALLAGLLLIAYAVVSFTEETPFPGTNSLIPCLGTCLALFGGSSRALGSVLRSRPMVFTGLISYSLYLCHWPLYVYFIYVVDVEELSYLQVAFLTLLSYIGATLMYRFVERPFRFAGSSNQAALSSMRFALGCALMALVISYASASAWANQGWYWRFGNQLEIEEVFDLDAFRIETIEYNRVHVKGATFGVRGKRILVVGDSHSRDVSNGLHLVLADRGYTIRRLRLDDKCLAQINLKGKQVNTADTIESRECINAINTYKKSLKALDADIIINSSAFSQSSGKEVGRFVKLAQRISRNGGMHMIVMDRAVDFRNMHAKAIKAYAEDAQTQNFNKLAARSVTRSFFVMDELEQSLSDYGVRKGVLLASKRDLQCNESACDFFTPQGELAVWDINHWTLRGAELFMSRFVDSHPDLFP